VWDRSRNTESPLRARATRTLGTLGFLRRQIIPPRTEELTGESSLCAQTIQRPSRDDAVRARIIPARTGYPFRVSLTFTRNESSLRAQAALLTAVGPHGVDQIIPARTGYPVAG